MVPFMDYYGTILVKKGENMEPAIKAECSNKTNRKLRIKKDFLTESRLGYVMLAPAIIIIFLLAVYPTFRTFGYSLFDLKLNHPTKNATYLNYQVNLEKYFSNYDSAKGLLTELQTQVEGESKEKLAEYLKILESAHDKLLKQSDIAAKENKIREFTDRGKNIDDEALKFSSLNEDGIQTILNDYSTMREYIKKLKTEKKLQDNALQTSQLIDELRDSIITPNFVGIKNYTYYLNPENKDFWQALVYTFFFTVVSVFFELVLGMMIALIINRQFFGIGIVRAAVLVPWAIPTVVAALMWRFLYDGQSGFMAHVFANLHLIENSGVLLTTHAGATFAAIFADVWKTAPYMALLLLGGLQTIDNSLYEAAEVDGATKIQKFFRITLPILKPTILVALLFRTLDAFRIFDLIFVLTGGANSTETLSTMAYKTMFAQMEFGRGSTLSVIIFCCIALISFGYVKLMGAEILSDKR
jgi:multiple sugar transport system permease protein